MKYLIIYAKVLGLYHKLNRELSNVFKHLISSTAGATSNSEKDYRMNTKGPMLGRTLRLFQHCKQEYNLNQYGKNDKAENDLRGFLDLHSIGPGIRE